jgi:hypothetical protein
MRRLLLVALTCGLLAPRCAAADAFDHYLNPILAKAVESDSALALKELTADQVSDYDRVLKNIPAAMVIVRTNGGRLAKLLVQPAQQKVGDRTVPMLLIERYVTYKDGEEQTLLASGKGLCLFPGFRLNLDLGQVVPEELGGDVQFVVDGDTKAMRPMGKAKLFVLTKAMPEATPKKGPKLVVGDTFEPRYWNGTFKLYDDGRRSGKLVLKVEDDGNVTGSYYSDRDGAKYDLHGQIGKPAHSIQFTVKFPRSEQTFNGWLFTADAAAMAGMSRIVDRDAGFYAIRIEE